MKAIAVYPGKPNSAHLAELPMPRIADIPSGRGVLVKLLRVGVDGTDREINAGEYGAPPKGYDFLVNGHENFGQVVEVGPNVHEIKPGDFAVATVRRPGSTIYDRIGMSDMTTDDVYFEHGINFLHGFLTECYVDDADYIVKIPQGLRKVAVLLEPLTVGEKGISQAYELQRRLRIWRPKRAAVMGAGSIGLLVTLLLRLRGLQVATFGLALKPNRNAELVEALGATYLSTTQVPVLESVAQHGPYDIIFEATGFSPIVFESMQALGRNGVLILSSITGGSRMVQVPADKINQQFVLGNKVVVGTVNANREHFELGVQDMATAEAEYPGWLNSLLTHKVDGLDNYRMLFDNLNTAKDAIKIYCEIEKG